MAPIVWLIAGVALIAAEVLSGEFVLAMLGAGALATAGVAALGISIWLDVAVFAALSLGLVFFARPAVKRRVLVHRELQTNVDALVGAQATVVSTVDAHDGRVRIGGDVWSARSVDETEVLDQGQIVTVVEISGATAVVSAEL